MGLGRNLSTTVAHIIGSLKTGGAEILVLDSLSFLSKTARGSYICVHRKNGELKESFEKNQIRCFHLRKRSFFEFLYIFKLRKLLKKQNVTIVHAHQAIDALFAWLACATTGIKLVLTVHGFDHNESILAILIKKIILKRTNINVFVSQFQQRHYVSKYKLKLKKRNIVIYNGVSFYKFDRVLSHVGIRKQLSIPGDMILLGTVGSFSSGRDQMTICRFLNILHNQKIDFRCLFIGAKSTREPWLYDDCLDYCKDNGFYEKVYFLGVRKDVPTILPQLDAYIYSSAHDTFGISVVEAIAAGLPVFVNDWVVMKEITENGKYGVLYETKSTQDLFVKYLEFLDNRRAYLKRANQAAEAIRMKFDIGEHAIRLQNMYASLSENCL